MEIEIIVYGVLIPAFFAYKSCAWVAKRLSTWWGSALALITGFIIGFIAPIIAYGIMTYTIISYDGAFFIKMIGYSTGVVIVLSIFALRAVRKPKKT